MYLLSTTIPGPGQPELRLEQFSGDRVPRYAILSHTWKHDCEVLFSHLSTGTWDSKSGIVKVRNAMHQARLDGYEYIWIDNVCIDKSSSAELSEAINSMFAWYRSAGVCYAYLADVSGRASGIKDDQVFRDSHWWSRGWTLQELLAPAHVQFYSADWTYIGDKVELELVIGEITGIDDIYLNGKSPLQAASIAKRMSWAANRKTTRVEDIAYCLLGLFSVNMPLLYGEGSRAFTRFQEEIIRYSDDHSIFAWKADTGDSHHGLLADHPNAFSDSKHVEPLADWENRKPYRMSNMGLQIDLPSNMMSGGELGRQLTFEVALPCLFPGRKDMRLGIQVQHLPGTARQYARLHCSSWQQVQKIGSITRLFFPQSFVSLEQRRLIQTRDDYLVLRSLSLYDWDGQAPSVQHKDFRWRFTGLSTGSARAVHKLIPEEGRPFIIPADMGHPTGWLMLTTSSRRQGGGFAERYIAIFIGRNLGGALACSAIHAPSSTDIETSFVKHQADRSAMQPLGIWTEAIDLSPRKWAEFYVKVTITPRQTGAGVYDLNLVLWDNLCHANIPSCQAVDQSGLLVLKRSPIEMPCLFRACVPLKSFFQEPSVWQQLSQLHRNLGNAGYSVLKLRPDVTLRRQGLSQLARLDKRHLTQPPIERASVLWQWRTDNDSRGHRVISLYRKHGLRISDLLDSIPLHVSDSLLKNANVVVLEDCEFRLFNDLEGVDSFDPRMWLAVNEAELKMLAAHPNAQQMVLKRTIRSQSQDNGVM